MALPDEFEVVDKHGGHPEFRMKHNNSTLHFVLNMEEEWLDIIFAWSEQPGDMKRLIDGLVKQLPFNQVRFIAPMSEEEVAASNQLGEVLESRGLAKQKDEKEHHRNIRDAVFYYADVTDTYYDGREYEMLLCEWEVE